MNSKKIKILTLIGNNYGGTLQAFALFSTIKQFTNNVTIINYITTSTNKNYKDFLKKIVYIRRNIKFNKFRRKYLALTEKTVKPIDDGESIYIVGSDQVWNQRIAFNDRKNFFLDFVKETRRKSSYAASIGSEVIDDISENVTTISKLLSTFNYITVREKTAQKLLEGILKKEVNTVLDPTLLLTAEEWNTIVSRKQNSNYICVYTLGLNKDYENVINDVSEKLNTKIIDIYYKKRFRNELSYRRGCGPAEFVSLIAGSEYVVTNSFHGTIFAILYHKKFITITRGNMNSRIYDLLELLGLQERIVSEDEKNQKIQDILNKEIDYQRVELILEKKRKESISFLRKIIDIKEREL